MTRRRQIVIVRRVNPITLALTLASFLGASIVLMVPASEQATAAGAAGSGWSSGPHRVTRTYYPGGDTTAFTESSTVRVAVDKTTDLQSRERIRIRWSGATPTGGLQGNPFGSSGLNQEYPVAVLECRGTAARVTPETCWTATNFERTYSVDQIAAPWLDDRYNTGADAALVSGVDPAKLPKGADGCGDLNTDWAYHFTQFKAANGTSYVACNPQHMPPEAAVGSVDPPNEVFGQTRTDGTGSVDFEVRTTSENESLGCSHTVACSLVVIPIMGLSCKTPGGTCNMGASYLPGDRYDGTNSPTLATSGYLWWSPSNWRNRITVPLQFALPPNTCQLLTRSLPVPFYGSELLSQATLQWAPAYCLNRERFNWQGNAMPDDAAMALAGSGAAIAAQPAGTSTASTSGFAFAPTALTGFGIAYGIDDPTSGRPLKTLKLNGRLLAKLLTESYTADAVGAKHPGLETNPRTLEGDPEFKRLNPDFHPITGGTQPSSASTLLALSNGSAVISQLSAYIQEDPDALAFINGRADPWGMKVNPAYRRMSLPVSTWPLLDTWKPGKVGNDCLDANPSVYLQNIAAPVSSLRLISLAMLFNWPNTQTTCVYDPDSKLYTIGRGNVQSYGQRFMLGLVSLGDAARYGLPVASLQAAKGHYVAPTGSAIRSAVAIATQSSKLKPFTFDQAQLRRSRTAYPGTMVVYTAARTKGLKKADAAEVGQFIKVSATEGQVPGRGNGKLADGYVPLTRTGPTAKLYAAAMAAREAILAQSGAGTSDDAGGGGNGHTTPGAGSSTTTSPEASPAVTAGVASPGEAPAAPMPSSMASASTGTVISATVEPVYRTQSASSELGGYVLPGLVLVGLASGMVTLGGRIWLSARGLR